MKWMFAGLFLAALLIGAGFFLTDRDNSISFSNSDDAVKLMETGSNQVQAFKFAEGIANLETALEIDPSLAEAAIPLASAYARKGRIDEYKLALALADSLTSEIPDDQRRMLAQMRLGLRHRSQYSGMLDSLLTRLKKDQPSNIHVMTAVAEQCSQMNQSDKEFQAWHSILQKNPNFAEAYNRLGYFELNRGNYNEAIEHMKKYAFLAPGLANPHDSLGDVLSVMGEYEEAADEFRTSVAVQPDFYTSYINLGKTYLYRGMIKSGLDIMDQVHVMVKDTTLGRKVDQDLLGTYHSMQMIPEVNQMTITFLERYPEDEMANYYQSLRLAYLGQWKESQALRDSSFNSWRSKSYYKTNPSARLRIDVAEKAYEAYVADLADQPSTRVRKWELMLSTMNGEVPVFMMWDTQIRLANAYLDNGEPLKAQELLRPILEVNNRLVPALVVAVKSDITLKNPQQARMVLEQLKWSIQQSDADYVGRSQAARLEEMVVALEGNP